MSFSAANMAVVAYALVHADGPCPEINSGVVTTWLGSGAGHYNIILPGSENMTDTEPLQQGQGDPKTGYRKDLILVTPIGTGAPGVSTVDQDEFTKQIWLGVEGRQCDFAVVILRPTIPTPVDNNGNQNGPE